MRSFDGQRTHHLHLVFRDRLRANAPWAHAYADLKRALAARFEHDRDGYTEAKSEFVESVLAAD